MINQFVMVITLRNFPNFMMKTQKKLNRFFNIKLEGDEISIIKFMLFVLYGGWCLRISTSNTRILCSIFISTLAQEHQVIFLSLPQNITIFWKLTDNQNIQLNENNTYIYINTTKQTKRIKKKKKIQLLQTLLAVALPCNFI